MLDTKNLYYFLQVANDLNMTKASNNLHLTQPTLSFAMKELEKSLQKKLFERTKKGILLTDEGLLLKKRAAEIINMINKTEYEILEGPNNISGTINFCLGETEKIHVLTSAMKKMNNVYPNVKFNIVSGDTVNVIDELIRGTSDFGLLFGTFDETKFDFIDVKTPDKVIVIMKKTDTLSKKSVITFNDLLDRKIIISRQMLNKMYQKKWLKGSEDKLNIVATYSLLYNATIMVKDDLGVVLCHNGLINCKGTNLIEREIYPTIYAHMRIIWRRNTIQSPIIKKFLEILQNKKL